MQSKEFISNCEALELVPAEELEFSSQERAETQATQRAKKAWLTSISLSICKVSLVGSENIFILSILQFPVPVNMNS
ncbi:hypothetical protein GW17_00017421 [Ensete ventricosum]|nr:hypothetical protein GW17_00017421 [Ensete ventricosum]